MKKGFGWKRGLLFAGMTAGFLALVGLFAGWISIQSYMKSDAFRRMLNGHVSRALGVDGEFESLVWTGPSVFSNRFSARPDGGLTGRSLGIQADGIRAQVDFSSIRRDAWEVEDIRINRVQFFGPLGMIGAAASAARDDTVPGPAKADSRTLEGGGLFSRWLPRDVEIARVTVVDADFSLMREENDDSRPVEGRDIRMEFAPLREKDGWSSHWSGGRLRWPGLPPVDVRDVHAVARGEGLYVTDAVFAIHETGRVDLSGEVASGGKLSMDLHCQDIEADRVLAPDWRQHLQGTIHGDVRVRGNASAGETLETRGRFWLENGVLQTLPVLDGIAEHTKTVRFRRLVLHKAEADFSETGDELSLRNIHLESDGLIRVTGTMTVDHKAGDAWADAGISGEFEVGVVRETLRWLPGAEEKVFVREGDGFLWTRMKVEGTLGKPREDLTPRLRGAAFEKAVEEFPEAAMEAGRQLLEGTLEGTEKVLRGTGEVIRQGIRWVPFLD